jgi:hypothetical protein
MTKYLVQSSISKIYTFPIGLTWTGAALKTVIKALCPIVASFNISSI